MESSRALPLAPLSHQMGNISAVVTSWAWASAWAAPFAVAWNADGFPIRRSRSAGFRIEAT